MPTYLSPHIYPNLWNQSLFSGTSATLRARDNFFPPKNLLPMLHMPYSGSYLISSSSKAHHINKTTVKLPDLSTTSQRSFWFKDRRCVYLIQDHEDSACGLSQRAPWSYDTSRKSVVERIDKFRWNLYCLHFSLLHNHTEFSWALINQSRFCPYTLNITYRKEWTKGNPFNLWICKYLSILFGQILFLSRYLNYHLHLEEKNGKLVHHPVGKPQSPGIGNGCYLSPDC